MRRLDTTRFDVDPAADRPAPGLRSSAGRALALWCLGLLLLCPLRSSAEAMRPLEIKEGYRKVLGVLAVGDVEAALAELMAFEQRVVGDQEQAWRRMEDFFRLKLRVLREMLQSQSLELLMPVTVLHHDAYFLYVEAGNRHLAHHSRQMASELAELYADRAGTPHARVFGGWILTSLGARLWSPSSIGDSADLFYRAVLVDPGNQTALLGLAAAYERSGDYPKAIEYLERVLQRNPADAEARLRWVLCTLRRERQPSMPVLKRLSALTAPEHPAWIRSVAFQEEARVRLDLGEVEVAESILRRGLAELPGDQQLSLALAALLDDQRRRQEALEVLDAIALVGWQDDSPRYRYDVWSPQDLSSERTRLHEEMRAGLVALGAGALGAPVEGAGG